MPAAALKGFDFILIDCPPSLSLLTLNALVAVESVMIPLQTEFFALEGVSQITRTIERVRAGLNTSLRLDGIVLTMFDRRNNLSEAGGRRCARLLPAQVFDTVIPRNIRVSEAPSHGLPVLLRYEIPRRGGLSSLAAEFLRRDRARRANSPRAQTASMSKPPASAWAFPPCWATPNPASPSQRRACAPCRSRRWSPAPSSRARPWTRRPRRALRLHPRAWRVAAHPGAPDEGPAGRASRSSVASAAGAPRRRQACMTCPPSCASSPTARPWPPPWWRTCSARI
jgi:hypothetical protein